MAKIKKEELETSEHQDVTKNVLNSLLNGYKEDHFNFIDNKPVKIPSGSLIWDSVAPLSSGSVCRFISAPELGKTSQCLLLASNYMKTIGRAETVLDWIFVLMRKIGI
jgi:hypothetical protein